MKLSQNRESDVRTKRGLRSAILEGAGLADNCVPMHGLQHRAGNRDTWLGRRKSSVAHLRWIPVRDGHAALQAKRAGLHLWSFERSLVGRTTVLLCRYHKRESGCLGNTLCWQERRMARDLSGSRRREWLVGRWLAHQALHLHARRRPGSVWIGREANGAPVLRSVGRARYGVSISHIDGWVCAAVHRARHIGIDIEEGHCLSAVHARYFLSSLEIEALRVAEHFPVNVWVAKEAAYKALRCTNPLKLRDLPLIPRRLGTYCQQFGARRQADGKSLVVEYRYFARLNLHLALAVL